jgi:hypothetical protein
VGRPRKIIPSHSICLWLPEDIYMRLKLHLFRESDRCIPRGAIQAFFVERLQDFFSGRASGPLSPSLSRETYLGLETIFATATKKGADPEEALRVIARWSRMYADKILESSESKS